MFTFKGEYVATPTEIPFIAEGTITAVYNTLTNTLTLYGVVDENGDVIEGGVVIGGSSAEGVTAIEVYGYTPWTVADELFTVVENTNTFGPNDELTFTAGTKVDRPISFLLNVTPASAEITADDIALINSKGEAFTNLEIVSVEPYDGYITKAGADYGVWKVTVKLTKYVQEEFDAAAYDEDGNNISYAFKVGDAITNYVIAFDHSDYFAANSNDATIAGVAPWPTNPAIITADGQRITGPTGLRNRVTAGVPDYVWRTYSKKYPTPAIDQKTSKDDKEGYTIVDGDPRAGRPYLPATVGKAIKIEASTAQYKAMYVTLDKAHANAGDPSELAAWESYDIAGLDVLSETGVINLNIKSKNANGDIIGFRVFAVNWDGTLSDPDGFAFYVMMGEDSSETWDAVETVVTPKKKGDYATITSDFAAIKAVKLPKNVATVVITPENLTDPAFTIVGLYENDKKTPVSMTGNWDKAAYLVTKPDPTETYQSYVDELAYNATVTLLDVNGFVLAEFPISFTKSLKDLKAPAGFSLKDGMLDASKNYYVYVPSVNGAAINYAKKRVYGAGELNALAASPKNYPTAATNAYYNNDLSVVDGEAAPALDLTKFYDFGTIPAADQTNFTTSISGASYVLATVTAGGVTADLPEGTFAGATGYRYEPITVAGTTYSHALPTSIVDNKAHKFSIKYDFGLISASLDNNYAVVPATKATTVDVDSFNVFFYSEMGNTTFDYNWNMVAAGNGTIGTVDWQTSAPNHNARVNYQTRATAAGWENVAPWTLSSTTATYAEDTFAINYAPVLYLNSTSLVINAANEVYGQGVKQSATYTDKLANILTADQLYIPADHVGVATDIDLATGKLEKAGDPYANVTLSNDNYFTVAYPAANAATFTFALAAGAMDPAAAVTMDLKVVAFDAFANKKVITLPVKVVPQP